MQMFPNNAIQLLEFEKIQELLVNLCQTELGKKEANQIRIHTKIEYIEPLLRQTYEYLLLKNANATIPNDKVFNLIKEIKLLSIQGSVLSSEQFMQLKSLLHQTEGIFRWFNNERIDAYPFLYKIIEESYYEKQILQFINEVFDEYGNIKDNASKELLEIRTKLIKKRNEVRKNFSKALQQLRKDGITAEIKESFLNNRRVIAISADSKRKVRGIIHGESDTGKTAFLEPEDTIELNNIVASLEREEIREINRILKILTASISVYSELISHYIHFNAKYDFIHAKASLAKQMNATLPTIIANAHIEYYEAYHPLLLLYNQESNKKTIPIDITLNRDKRILIISGPNAGGKTVSMKTVGLLQLMLQSGLLIPCSARSVVGIFKKCFIHIGDTQNLEFELSTYSSHLLHMKYFVEHADSKTLFFIDELGGGSDPQLGSAFAEVILQELAHKKSIGIVTTHFLNLKSMANYVHGIINGAMSFDEKNLLPLYKLNVGKPGSSYTFAIAERIGLSKELIHRAKKLVDEDHYKLEKLLNRTEQDLQKIEKQKIELEKILAENIELKKKMQITTDKAKNRQEIEILRQKNKISLEKYEYLKDMERKLKYLAIEWKKTDDKKLVVKQIQNLLLKQPKSKKEKTEAELEKEKFKLVEKKPENGDLVKVISTGKNGYIKEIKNKLAIVQIGNLPITVNIKDIKVLVENHGFESNK